MVGAARRSSVINDKEKDQPKMIRSDHKARRRAPQGGLQGGSARARLQSPRQPRQARPAPRWADLGNLLNEPDDHPRFGSLKAQMLRSLEQVVDMAEARLQRLIDAEAVGRRRAFRLLRGDKS